MTDFDAHVAAASNVLIVSDAEAAAILRGAQTSVVRVLCEDIPPAVGGMVLAQAGAPPFAAVDVPAISLKRVADLTEDDARDAGVSSVDALMRVLCCQAADAQVRVTQIRVSKVLSSAGVSNAGLWSAMNAEEIPSKPTLHPTFLDALHALWRQAGACASDTLPPENPRVLDLGCGDGRLALSLVEEAATWGVGVDWVGTDVCGNAVQCARRLAHNAGYSPVDAAPPAQLQLSASEQQRRPRPRMSFLVGDATSVDITQDVGFFDVVLCQLVISVVGSLQQRKACLKTAFRHLRPGGVLLLSSSGASEDVNSQYKELYDADLAITGEFRTYLSRSATGSVLYVTHHFSADEIADLLMQTGFTDITTHEALETSSRRPDEAARFLYTICVRR